MQLMDAYQLPPINETISKVFSSVTNKSTLTTIVRQGKDNPMSDILLLLRNDIKNHTNKGIPELLRRGKSIHNNKGFKCLLNDSKNNFGSEMLQYFFSSEYKVNTNHIKFLSYMNTDVELWCNALRREIYKEDYLNILNIGEGLMGYNTVINNRTNSIIIENSEDYKVVEVTKGLSSYNIEGFHVRLENTIGYIKYVFIVDHNNIDLFREVAIEKLEKAQRLKRGYWKQWFIFKQEHLLLESIAKNPDIAITVWGNLLCKKDLYYNYGCTVHKSQGSSYENVAINLMNLYKNRDVSERARLVYVALSRTKNMNLILVK